MAGGPLAPWSTNPMSANVFPQKFTRNSQTINTLGVIASLPADAIWMLYWRMPEVMPSGTMTLRLDLYANATSGNARINPKWVRMIPNTDRIGGTVVAEGVTTVTWSAGQDYMDKTQDFVLDATTAPAASQQLEMALTFETSSWTLAQVLGVVPWVVWT